MVDDRPSAFAEAMGIRVVAWGPGTVRLEAPVAPWHLNRTEILHGGVAAAMLDMACGFAGLFVAPGVPTRQAVTLALTVNYTGTTRQGRLVAEVRVKLTGRKVYFSEADLLADDGSLIAFATGVFRYRDRGEA